jgi:hypothetical protein
VQCKDTERQRAWDSHGVDDVMNGQSTDHVRAAYRHCLVLAAFYIISIPFLTRPYYRASLT